MNWFAAHLSACRLALRRLAATPLNTGLALFGMGLLLALPTAGIQLATPFASLAQGTATTPRLTVFLPVDAERKTTQALHDRIAALPGVAGVALLAREDTLVRMKTRGGLAEAIDALPKNPFPDALVVTPAETGPAALDALAQTLRDWRGIEHVDVDADWARRLAALARLYQVGALLLGGLLGAGLLAIVFLALRLHALTRPTTPDARAVRPFLWQGALLGLASAGVAWLIAAGILLAVRDPVDALASLYGLELRAAFPGMTATALLCGGAVILGFVGAGLSAGRQPHPQE